MKYCTFQRLASMLRAYIIAASGKKQGSQNYIPNGPISTDVRLACALRWFAGGSIYDIMTTYGIGHTDTIESCWYVVDEVNNHPNFTIVCILPITTNSDPLRKVSLTYRWLISNAVLEPLMAY